MCMSFDVANSASPHSSTLIRRSHNRHEHIKYHQRLHVVLIKSLFVFNFEKAHTQCPTYWLGTVRSLSRSIHLDISVWQVDLPKQYATTKEEKVLHDRHEMHSVANFQGEACSSVPRKRNIEKCFSADSNQSQLLELQLKNATTAIIESYGVKFQIFGPNHRNVH